MPWDVSPLNFTAIGQYFTKFLHLGDKCYEQHKGTANLEWICCWNTTGFPRYARSSDGVVRYGSNSSKLRVEEKVSG